MKKIFTVLGIVVAGISANAQIVINEVYGGGGNSGAPYKNDFIELKNIGSTTVTLSGAYIQYAAAAGTFNGGTNTHSLPDITLAPGKTYLIAESSGGANGVDLPTADATGALNISGTAGKVALTSSATAVTSATSSNVIDFVGFGSTASYFEGTGPAPAPSNTTSISRISGDTNNNATDFAAGAPTPQNSSSVTLAVSDLSTAKGSFVRNTFVQNDEIIFGTDAKDVKVYNMYGQIVKTASVQANGSVNVAELQKGNYIVTGTVNNKPVSQKILKD